MHASPFRFCSATLLVGVYLGLSSSVTRAEPFTPRRDDQVLERVRIPSSSELSARKLRQMRARLASAPEDLGLAIDLARHCIERSRSEADPRYLGQAQSALAHWWELPNPPVDVLVLRATIKQSLHEFTDALTDLDEAVRVAPANAQVWLTRATILTVLGRYNEARHSCLPLVRLAPELIAVTAAANVASVSGQAVRACETLENALQRTSNTPAAERLWALTVLAETEARLGRTKAAEADFRQGLQLQPRDPYLLGAYADFLLDQQREPAVSALLQSETQVDSLLLRLALAEAALKPTPAAFKEHVAMLQVRLETNRLRGTPLHQREEARFALHLRGRPEEALRLARANWDVQHEPADVLILLESALAARDRGAAEMAWEFAQANHLEDINIKTLGAELSELQPTLTQ